MIRRTRIPVALTVAVLGAVVTVPTVAASGSLSAGPPAVSADWSALRLITNAGFEAPGLDDPSYAAPGWTAENDGRFAGIERTVVRSGKQALRVRKTNPTRSESAQSESIAVTPGEQITVTAWAKNMSGKPGNLTLQFWRADGTPITRSYGRSTAAGSVSGGWQQVTTSRITPDDAIRATVVLSADVIGDTVWDDVSVRSVAPSAYLVPDGDFEDTRDDQVHTHWTYTGDVVKQNDDVWANARALDVTGTVESDSSARSFDIPVVPGDTLDVTAWAKVAAGNPGVLRLDYVAIDRTVVDPGTRYYRTTGIAGGLERSADAGGWHQLSVTSAVPTGATHLRIVLASDGVGTTRWDDLRIAADSDAGLTAYASGIGAGSVLFVGDEKVEGYTGLTRVVQPGTKTGDENLAAVGDGVVMVHPEALKSRTVSAVKHEPGGDWRMWFLGTQQGYLESDDGIHWQTSDIQPTTDAPSSIVDNPRYGEPGQPKYFGLKIGFAESDDTRQRTQNYYVYVSDDGLTWTRPTPNIPAIHGRDTVMVSWDPVGERFVATVKQWFMTTASPGTYWWEPRSAWVSFSDDFATWTQPRLVFQSDVRDYQKVAGDNPGKHTASDVYSLPTFRYGEQILALPWMQDITGISRIINMGQDVSTEHIELASSQNYLTWSRPSRDPIVSRGATGEWDWGFQMTSSNGFIVDGDTVRLYYGSYEGEHACTQARKNAGDCDVVQVPSRIGTATWKRDRFVALRSTGSSAGTVTTRTLDPAAAAGQVHLNAVGTVRVEVLTADGNPVPGYTLAESTPVVGDTLDTVARWGDKTTLPTGLGELRLRIAVQGDLYSYSIAPA